MNNSVGYARPARFENPVALGTDGIGADMLEEFRLAYVAARAADVTTTPDLAWQWLSTGWDLMPAALNDQVVWAAESDDPWALAFTTGTSPLEVCVDGETVWEDGNFGGLLSRIEIHVIKEQQPTRKEKTLSLIHI